MEPFRTSIRVAIFRKLQNESHDISETIKQMNQIINEFSTKISGYDEDEKMTIELTVPVLLPPNESTGFCESVVREVELSFSKLGGGSSTICNGRGSWINEFTSTLEDDKTVIVSASIPIRNWDKSIPVLRRLIKYELQLKLKQKCVFLQIDGQTYGKPLNLLSDDEIKEFPKIDDFGKIDPSCASFSKPYQPPNRQLAKTGNNSNTVQTSGDNNKTIIGVGPEVYGQEVERRTKAEVELGHTKKLLEEKEKEISDLRETLDSNHVNYSEETLEQSQRELDVQKKAIEEVDLVPFHSIDVTDFRNVLTGTGKITLPSFQRSYEWVEDHLEKYWAEISVNKELFLGTLMFMNEEGKRICVDGVQRLLTVCIHLSAIRDTIIRTCGYDENKNAEAIHSFIDRTNNLYVPAIERFKLIQTDSSEVNEILYLEHGEDIGVWNYEDLDENLSGGLLTEAYLDFRNWLHHAANNYDGPEIEYLMGQLDTVLNIGFYVLTVDGSIEDALLVFSQINEKGRKLTQEDLIFASIHSMSDRIGKLVRTRLSKSEFRHSKPPNIGLEVENEIGEILNASQFIERVDRNYAIGKSIADFIFTTSSDEMYILEVKLMRKRDNHFMLSMLRDPEAQIEQMLRGSNFSFHKKDIKDFSFIVDENFICVLFICKIISNISKEWVDLLEQIKQIADANRAKSDKKIGELKEKLAKLAEENEKLQKKVAEVDNPPPSLLNQMDTANRSLNKLISEFRTPGTVAQIMVHLARPTGGKIYDGCCGDGDLLLEAHRYAETEQQNEPLQYYGQELNKYAWNQAKANFANQGIEVDLGPSHGSTLHNPHHLGLSFDYVISDISFGMKLSPKLDPKDPRWALTGQTGIREGDVAWILHSLHQLASSGTCIIHVPVGTLFRSNKETSALRKFLIEENLLSGIVALKPKIIPSTSIQTCILILEKRGSDSVRKSSRGVFMMDCSEYEGIKRKNFYALSKLEISSIVDAYTDWYDKSATPSVDLPPNCKVITAEDIIENDYNLMPDRYL